MALQIDSADLFDLDARTEKAEEHLFVLGPLGKRYLLCREPSIKQLSALQIKGSGRDRDPAGAARDFLSATILSREEIEARLDGLPDELPDDLEAADISAALVEAERLVAEDAAAFVDFEDLIERLDDPLSEFTEEHLSSISTTIMRRATGFPTKPSSDSSRSRSRTGSRSRAGGRRRASTPSD